LAAFLAALLLYASLLWYLNRRFHQKLRAAFLRPPCSGPGFTAVSEILDDLNEDCAHFVFTAQHSGNNLFHDKPVTLIYGRVGSRSPGGIRGPVWTLRKAVYALVPPEQAEWMKSHSGIFTHAASGYRCSIFWVNLDAFLAG